MIDPAMDRGGLKNSENAPTDFFQKSTGLCFDDQVLICMWTAEQRRNLCINIKGEIASAHSPLPLKTKEVFLGKIIIETTRQHEHSQPSQAVAAKMGNRAKHKATLAFFYSLVNELSVKYRERSGQFRDNRVSVLGQAEHLNIKYFTNEEKLL